jgi:2-polyprenyl-6-methoxyphenol hydroxylase-like FAD-dependent oxidoreductase
MNPADQPSAAPRPLHVLIIGGGIGGLCLAQGLKRVGVSFAVYERDRTPDARLQGYRLNIEPVGAKALHECLPPELWSLFVATAGDVGGGMGVYDEHLRELMREDPPPPPATPTDETHAVSRATLRRLLLAALEAEVTFGKEFVRFEKITDDKVRAIFADGSSATGDVLVGADGVNSRVCRQLLPNAKVIDTGGFGIGGKLPLNPDVEAWLPSHLLQGKSMILPKRDFLFTAVFRRRASSSSPDGLQQLAGLNRDLPGADREDVDYIMWAYVARRSGDLSTADGLRGQALRDRVAQRISPWHPDLRRLIAESDEGTIEQFDFRAAVRIRPWQSTNITLLGDAVHAMPPVGGIGGNIALADASELCRSLKAAADGWTSLLKALSAYEADMIKRGFAAVDQSRLYLQLAIFPSRIVRAVARTFFRSCGAFPFLRRAVFGTGS